MDMSKRRRRRAEMPFPLRRRRVSRIRPGSLPGTLLAAEHAEPPRISVLAFSKESVLDRQVDTIDHALAAVLPAGVTWINVDGLGDSRVLVRLAERFGLHALALEDVLDVPQRPKVERYQTHYFMVLRTMRRAPDAEIIEEQVSIFFGRDWVVTVQEHSGGDCFAPVRDAIRQGRGRVRESGADYLAYLLLDATVDAYFPVIETVAEHIHELEGEAIASGSDDTLLRIQRLRHELLGLRRAVWPMREEIGVLLRDESDLVAAETRVFLRDAYDHAIQALEIVESLRETAVSVMEVYLSAQNQRLNAIMKVLTVISTVFIPLTFIASIYGMNFQHMPELHWRYGYAFALGVMAVTAAVTIAYFRRRGWW
jgi:magnesium transporter